jgi:hypothetical protein
VFKTTQGCPNIDCWGDGDFFQTKARIIRILMFHGKNTFQTYENYDLKCKKLQENVNEVKMKKKEF